MLLAALTFLVELALGRRRIGRSATAPRLGVVLVAVAITVEEATQALMPHRTLSPVDLACSWLGIWLGALAASRVLDQRDRTSAPPSGMARRLELHRHATLRWWQ